MEEVSDFEGFTIEDYLFSMRFKRIREEMLKRNCASHHSFITEMRRGKPSNHTIKRDTCTDIQKFWQIREQYTFDTPHTVCDHGSWFEKITANLCSDIHQKLELSYKCYKKVVNLESCANITMFLNDCSEITTQCLWEHLVQQIKGRFTKSWLELTLIISPLFFFDDIHKVWKRKGISHCEGKKEIYPFIHWLGVLDQRKAWADLGSPEQNAELRMETIKTLLLKQSLLTVEDIAKIISSTFRVPQCQQLTELVLLTLTSCKIFHKSQDQEDGVASSVHLEQVAPRLNETKRISKPSQHYRRAARTAALYEELKLDGNTSEPSIDLEMKNFWLKRRCASTQNSFCEEPVERERESCLMCEKHEETESNFFHNQAYLLSKGGMLKEELRQDSDIVQCSMSKSHKLSNHRQFMNKQYKHTLKVSSQDHAPKEDLARKNICHKTTHNNEKELFDDCYQYLQGGQGKNSCTNDNEHFTSDQMKVRNSQKCQPEEITDMEDSLSLYCSESENDCTFLTDTLDDDFESEQSLLQMEDSNSEISQKNPLISFTPLVKSSRQYKDNEEYRCPLFARTSYYISTPSQTLKDALPNQLHLGSRHDTFPLMVVKKDGGLLTHLKKFDIHTQSKDTGAEFGNILNKEANKVYDTKIAISNRSNMFQQNSDTVKPTSSSIHSESMLPVSSKGSFTSERFNKAKKRDDLPRCHPHELNVVPKREPLEASEEHLLSQSQKNIETLRQNPLPQDSPKIQNLTKNLRLFRMSRNIQSSVSLESSHLDNKSQNMGIREPSDSHQTLNMSEENAGDKQCISLPRQRDEIIKDASPKILSGQQHGPNEIDLKMESEELKQQNTHATMNPIEEHSYAMNISKKPVMKNNLNRQNAVKESLKQSEPSRIFVINDSEDLGVAQQCEKQTVKNSPEACNVSQDHFTTKSSDQLFAGTSAVKQQTNEGSTTPLKRQRWKSFKLRDGYEEIVYQMKVQKVKNPNTQPFVEETMQKVKKPKTQPFVEETMQKVKKPKTQPFVEETMQKVKKPKTQPFVEETMQKVKKPKTQPFDEETLQKLKKPLLMGWIRELVQRKICSSSNKDVYYHTPEGKKLRSSVEVDRYLAMMRVMDLSRENFTFFRAELGFGKPLEVIRDAAIRDAKLKVKCVQHTSDNQGQTSSRIPKRRFPNDNTTNSKSKSGESLTNLDTLPNDRFWITCFDDLDNSMETDTAEIVNENGELTGFEEWSVDGVVHTSVASTSTSSVPISKSLSTVTTATITTTASTSTTYDTFTTPGTSTTPSSSVTSNTFSKPRRSTTLKTFTKFKTSFTPNITTTLNTPITTTISIPHDISSTQNILPTQRTSSTFDIGKTSAFTSSTFVANGTISARPHTTTTPTKISIAPHKTIVTSTCTTRVSKTKSCSTATSTSTSQTSIPTSLMSTFSTITTTQAGSTICDSISKYGGKINTVGSKTNAQTSIPKIHQGLTSTAATALSVSASNIDLTYTSPTSVSPDSPIHISPLISSDNTTHTLVPIASPHTTMEIRARASPSNTTSTGTLPDSSTHTFFSIPHSHSNMSEDNRPASPTPMSFEPKILQVYNPADAQKLYDMLDSPDPDSKKPHKSVSAVTSQLSNSELEGGITKSPDCKKAEDKSEKMYEQTNTDFTYAIPTCRMDRNSVTKIRVKDYCNLFPHISRPKHANSISQPSDKNSHQLSTSNFNNKQLLTPFLDNTKEDNSLGIKFLQQQLQDKRNNQQPTQINSNISQILKYSNAQQSTLTEGHEQHLVVTDSKEQQPVPVSTNIQSLSTLNKSNWSASCNIQQPVVPFGSSQQSSSVNSNRQQQISGNSKSQKIPDVIGNCKRQFLVLSNNAQCSTLNSSSQQPTPGNNQDPTPDPNKIQQSAPLMNNKQPSISVVSSSKLLAQPTICRQQLTPVTTNKQLLTSLGIVKQQSSLIINNKQQTIPVFSTRQQTDPVVSRRQQTTLVFSTRQQTTPVFSTRQQTTPVFSTRQQTTPVFSTRQQTTPIFSTRKNTPVFSTRQQTTPGFSTRQQTGSFVNSKQQTNPLVRTTPVFSTMQQVDPVVRYLSTSVTSSKEQSPLRINSSHNHQPAPVISSRQQLTTSLSSKEQSTPGTDNNQFIPVMSIQQSLTDVRDQDQSLPSPGSKCQATQYKVNDQQIKYVMSNYEQMTTNRSDDNKTYPDNHDVITTLAVSNLQEPPPVMSTVQQKTSHMTSVYHTIPLVGENQLKISHMGHVEPIIQHTSIEHLIPEEQIISISNTQLTSIPTTLSEPVLTVSNMQPDSYTVPQVSYSMLAPVMTSHTNESLKKQSASAPWQFITSPHSNTEPQRYMMILPQKEIEHKTPELTVKSMEKVKSTMHVKDSTSYGNKSNRAKVEGRQIKQTARKSTKARPTKSKLATQLDKLFVDVGILSTETQHSMTENNEFVSEADRIKGGVADNSPGMPMTWDFSSNETNCDKSNFLQPQVLSGLPEMANASNTVQSFNNISDSTKVRPPPPLKQFFPQTKRKVTRVTCPPLTPLHKMTKLSPEASEYWLSSSTTKTDII